MSSGDAGAPSGSGPTGPGGGGQPGYEESRRSGPSDTGGKGSPSSRSDRFKVTTAIGFLADAAAILLLLREGADTIILALCLVAAGLSVDAIKGGEHVRRAWTTLAIAVAVGALSITGGLDYAKSLASSSTASSTTKSSSITAPVSTGTGLVPVGMTGGCTTFRIYAQNKFNPVGSAIRTAPTPTAPIMRTIAPNYQMFANGYVQGDVAYPLNRPPLNNNIWFHLSDGGWVSFAGVRSLPTDLDPTGRGDDGPLVPLLSQCLGVLQ